MFPSRLATILIAAYTVVCGVEGISVPTGKETPITPARPTPPPPVPRVVRAPAPVVEYSQDHPEPPPLDPSYLPVTYKYLSVLTPKAIYYVPLRLNVPSYDIPEINTRPDAKPEYQVKVIDYAAPKRQYLYQEETKPEYHFVRKTAPYKQAPSKAAYVKDYVYRSDSRPNKSGYPKKASAYPEQSKYYYNNNNNNNNYNNNYNYNNNEQQAQQ